jgi:hypothetical protein
LAHSKATGILRALRALLWASAAGGIFVAFAWPFVVSPDPASTVLRWIGTAIAATFLVVLALAAWLTAARGDHPKA